ncbi:hypothetical protein DFH08DRAFT_1073221 [Mycena albidolilacea]|uniref:Uncharacterized protein n=1 Tax=Mycena albidolilacea TaxID=1033008 RepID=A0AAD7APB5_9AGAR|nr:hypothetical protein DFH08DRAFT_1073221 [Mycena albidolilacea]
MSWLWSFNNQPSHAHKERLAANENATKLEIAARENAAKERIAASENATKERIAKMHADRRELAGGTGGKGGKSRKDGGHGGAGEASKLTFEQAAIYHQIIGGTGGEGGEGDVRGGDGGVGHGQRFEKLLVPGVTGRVPYTKTAKFCEDYELDEALQKLLKSAGFSTVGALLKVTDTDLREAHFKSGHIAELVAALEDWVATNVK